MRLLFVSWTKEIVFHPTLDEKKLSFVQSWMKETVFHPTLDKTVLSFVQSWTKRNCLSSNFG